MIKILLPLTLLFSTLGIQAASAAAPCAADVKRLSADTREKDPAIASEDVQQAVQRCYERSLQREYDAPAIRVPEDMLLIIERSPDESIIVDWLLQNPASHKDAVMRYNKPLLAGLIETMRREAVDILLDCCPNVLNPLTLHAAMNFPLHCPETLPRITRMMYLQGTSLQDIEHLARHLSRASQLDHNALQVVFNETEKIRQELGEATECEAALKDILLTPLRAITRTFITDLPVPKQP